MPAHFKTTLPSHGEFYKDASGNALLPGGEIFVRKMTLDEEETVQSPGLDVFTRLSLIGKNSCILANEADATKAKIKFDDLLFTDQQAALLRQRLITHGANYVMEFRCTSCGNVNKNTHNIENEWEERTPERNLAMAREQGRADFTNEEPFTVHLPDADKDVTFRFLRVKDVAVINRLVKQFRAATKDAKNPTVRFTLAQTAETISGDTSGRPWDVIQKAEWFRHITSSDHRHIRQERELRETCIDTTLHSTCKNCGTVNEVSIEMNAEFFLPA
jgi:hypothetical protein